MYVCVMCVGVCVCLQFQLTPVDSYNLSSHYCSLTLKGAPWLERLVTVASNSWSMPECWHNQSDCRCGQASHDKYSMIKLVA